MDICAAGRSSKGLLALLFEAVVALFTLGYGIPNLAKFGTLGTVKRAAVYNAVTMKNEVNVYDNSFLILLFSLVTLVLFAAALILLMRMVVDARELQRKRASGEHVNTFREDIREMFNEKFNITLLSLPTLGILVFTIIPLLFMILVAFTNYDQSHMAPTELFTWVGLDNFTSVSSITRSAKHSAIRSARCSAGRSPGRRLQPSPATSGESRSR